MKSIANLTNSAGKYDDGLESIVIVNSLGDIPRGVTLDVSAGLPTGATVIKAGHIIVKSNDGKVKPLAVTGDAYSAKGATDTYLGVLKHSILVSDPRAAVLTMGQINAAACPYPVTDDIARGLPNIEFLNRKSS